MDLGATICTRGRPGCAACPVAEDCVARTEDRTAELPAARPRRALPERETTMLMLVADGQVLLLPRPPTGVWGGLLSLPEVDDERQVPAALRRLGCELLSMERLPALTHTFTHFRLSIQPLHCLVQRAHTVTDADHRWLPLQALDSAPLPTPVGRLLKQIAANHAASARC